MTLSRKQVEAFQDIYKKSFGEEISYQDALGGGIKLLELMRIIYWPITKKTWIY